MDKKMRKTIVFFCIFLVINGTPYNVLKYIKKYQRVNVENHNTNLLKLCYPYHRDNFLNNLYSSIDGILLNNIVGLGVEEARKFGNNDLRPILRFELYWRAISHIKVCSGTKPILTDIELYKLDNEYYVKVFYIITKDGAGYSAVYKYDSLEEKLVTETMDMLAIRKEELNQLYKERELTE